MFNATHVTDIGRHTTLGAGINATDAPAIESHSVELPTGRLDIKVFNTVMPLNDICGFAARQNPKRGFLFVSKVLGKHIPVRPSKVREVHTRLAAQIPADLPGPVVVIGMAETAICLGNGVFDEYVRLSGRRDVMFTQSTRYRLNKPVAIEFLEEHSHAADHIIYEPEDEALKAMFYGARSLVLIDDEASTGKTFVNLVRNMTSIMPGVQHVVTGVITDWRGPKRTKETLAAMPCPASTIAILHGEYQFTPSPTLKLVEMPKVTGSADARDAMLPSNLGRLGLPADFYNVNQAAARCIAAALTSVACPALNFCAHGQHGEKFLVLGTGEFAYPPFLLAEALERSGFNVLYQSTTRSPIMVNDELAIRCRIEHTDNYGDGIVNFIYNARREDYDRVLICHETPQGSVDDALVRALDAETLEMHL